METSDMKTADKIFLQKFFLLPVKSYFCPNFYFKAEYQQTKQKNNGFC